MVDIADDFDRAEGAVQVVSAYPDREHRLLKKWATVRGQSVAAYQKDQAHAISYIEEWGFQNPGGEWPGFGAPDAGIDWSKFEGDAL